MAKQPQTIIVCRPAAHDEDLSSINRELGRRRDIPWWR